MNVKRPENRVKLTNSCVSPKNALKFRVAFPGLSAICDCKRTPFKNMQITFVNLNIDKQT